MAIQSTVSETDKLCLSEVRTELELTGKLCMNDAVARKLAGMFTGRYCMSDFLGKSKPLLYYPDSIISIQNETASYPALPEYIRHRMDANLNETIVKGLPSSIVSTRGDTYELPGKGSHAARADNLVIHHCGNPVYEYSYSELDMNRAIRYDKNLASVGLETRVGTGGYGFGATTIDNHMVYITMVTDAATYGDWFSYRPNDNFRIHKVSSLSTLVSQKEFVNSMYISTFAEGTAAYCGLDHEIGMFFLDTYAGTDAPTGDPSLLRVNKNAELISANKFSKSGYKVAPLAANLSDEKVILIGGVTNRAAAVYSNDIVTYNSAGSVLATNTSLSGTNNMTQRWATWYFPAGFAGVRTSAGVHYVLGHCISGRAYSGGGSIYWGFGLQYSKMRINSNAQLTDSINYLGTPQSPHLGYASAGL